MCTSGSRQTIDLESEEISTSDGRRTRGAKMAADYKIQALDIRSNVEDFLESYEIENLVLEEDLIDYISKIGDLKKDYRRVHTHLKSKDKDFANNYPDYHDQLSFLNENFKTATEKLKFLKEEEERRALNKKNEEVEQARRALESEKLQKELASIQKVSDEKRSHAFFEWNYWENQVQWILDTSSVKWRHLNPLSEN